VRGTVVDEPKLKGRLRLLLVDVSTVSKNAGNSWQDAHGQMTVQTTGTLIEDPYGANYGDSVELQGKLQSPLSHSAPGVFASMVFPRVSVHSGSGNLVFAALYKLRLWLAGIIAWALPQPEAALLTAIVLGLQTPAIKPLIDVFNHTGTAHLIVPSGFKVTILAGLVASSMKWLYDKEERSQTMILLPAQRKKGRWRRWTATAVVLASIAAYTILSGAGPAALRAGIMGMLLVVAPRLDRIYNIYTALALAALLMTLLDPFSVWNAGFQLSLLGTLGISLLTPLFQRLLRQLEHLPLGHHAAELLAVTLAAQVATLPIFALDFKQISFIAPLANALTVPLLGVLITLGMLICGIGLLFTPLALVCGWIAWPLLWYTDHIITWCSAIPGAYMQVGSVDSVLSWAYYGLLVLLTGTVVNKLPGQLQRQLMNASPLPSRHTWRLIQLVAALAMVLATGTMALAAQPSGRLTITFLSLVSNGQAPQGEAILVSTADGKTILIDGGLDPTPLGEELDSRLPFWQRSLDMVVLTSPRPDHLGGLQDIISRYQVGEVVDAGMLHPNTAYALWRRTIEQRGLHYIQVRQGAALMVGRQFMLQVLWPSSPLHKSSNEERDNALALRLVAPGVRMLLLGNTAESKFALAGLLTGIDQSYLRANIVQVAAEASKDFPTELSAVLQAVHPSQLLITPGELTSKQRKAGVTTIVPPSALVFEGSSLQVIQTAQVGAVEVDASDTGWNIQAA
jgi:competence protein ComEC